VVDALIRLVEAGHFDSQIFNVGTTEEVAIASLAERVVELVGGPSRIVQISYEEAHGADFEDMARRVPDIRRVREAVGWYPRRDLSEILADVIEHERTVSLAAIESLAAPSS
jgi:UDP-glucose 4-epimerase